MKGECQLQLRRYGLFLLVVVALTLLPGASAGPRDTFGGAGGPALAGPPSVGLQAAVAGEDPVRGAWMSTDAQVMNLAPSAQPITGTLFNPAGEPIAIFTDTLPGGAAGVYQPAGLPPAFSGTLVLETPARAAMGVLHLRAPAEATGNTIFLGIPDELVQDTSFIPIDHCTRLFIYNPGDVAVSLGLNVFDLGGILATVWGGVLGSQAVISLRPIDLGLGFDFVGQGVLQAGGPVVVTVRSDCGGWSAFIAPTQGSTVLHIPRLPPNEPPLVTTTIAVENTSGSLAATMAITYSSGLTEQYPVPPLGGLVLLAPFTDTVGSAVIRATTPVVAVVRVVTAPTDDRGDYTYPAFAPAEATNAVALPVLFSDYQGWSTGSRIWVRNLGAEPAQAAIRYVTVPTGTVFWDRAVIDPGAVQPFVMPAMPSRRAAAIVLADQPIVALTGAYNPDEGLDRHISYRGVNFNFDCDEPAWTDFSWTPLGPQAGQPVTFTAWVNGARWLTATVDSAGDVGQYTSLALDSAGRPRISYVDAASGTLKYAWYDGSAWHTEIVDDSGSVDGYTSLALDSLGLPHISYHAGGNLNYASYDGTLWSVEIVELPGDAGFYNSLALDVADQPHISYYVNGDLLYAHKIGPVWDKQLVDGPGWQGQYNSLALDSADRPHISYCDWGNFDLRYAHSDGSTWISETVDSFATVCPYSSLALDSAGRPHISYYDQKDPPAGGDLRYAYYDGTAWVTQTVDSPGSVGRYTSLVLDSAGRPHISYYDETNGDLKYAWYDGSTWDLSTVDSASDVGQFTSLKLDTAGQPRVSYYDAGHGDLRFARQAPAPTPPISFTWALGDAVWGIGQTLVHSYTLPGVYDVTVWARNCLGFGVVSATHPLTVTAVHCDPVEILTVTTAISSCQVTFTAGLTGTAPFSYRWDLGSFGSSIAPAPTVDFGQSGTYPYTLTVSNCDAAYQALYSGTVTVQCAPHCDPVHGADFVWSPPSPMAGEEVLFEGFALGTPPFTYTWALGDLGVGSGSTVTHTYTLTGTYSVVLSVTNPCGGDLAQHDVTVVPGPARWTIYLPLVFRGYSSP